MLNITILKDVKIPILACNFSLQQFAIPGKFQSHNDYFHFTNVNFHCFKQFSMIIGISLELVHCKFSNNQPRRSLLIQISVSMITLSAKGSLLPSVPCPVYWQTSYWIISVSASFSVTLHAIDHRLLGPSQALKLVHYLSSSILYVDCFPLFISMFSTSFLSTSLSRYPISHVLVIKENKHFRLKLLIIAVVLQCTCIN